jgi:hypothetical protein
MKNSSLSAVLLLLMLVTSVPIDPAHATDHRFTVTLSNVYFEKETVDFQENRSTYSHYTASHSRHDWGFQGTFDEEQGLYELHWSPPPDEGYITRELIIKVYLSDRYSPEKKIKFLRYDYSQKTNDPKDPKDLGIHSWFLEAKDIPFVENSGGRLKFELRGHHLDTHIEKYEMINQGNPRFRSIERVDDTGAASSITVDLDLEADWWFTVGPDIEVVPDKIVFRVARVREEPQFVRKRLEVRNLGNVVLHVIRYGVWEEDFLGDSSTIRIRPPWEPNRPSICAEIYPGGSCELDVDFFCANLPYNDFKHIYVQSDDPDEKTVNIDVYGVCGPILGIYSMLELLLLDALK